MSTTTAMSAASAEECSMSHVQARPVSPANAIDPRPARRPVALFLAPFAVLCIMVAGCGSAMPSKELVDARKAYAKAAQGDAQRLVPDRVLTAKQALDEAEAAENDDPGSPSAITRAYVAQRKALLAETFARIAIAKTERSEARKAYQAELETRHKRAQSDLSRTTSQLGQTQGQLSERERKLAELEAELAKRADELAKREAEIAARDKTLSERTAELSQRDQELARERAARAAAETRYKAALKSLEEIGQVKEDERGTVLTFSGAVLFGTGRARLLPIAREQLTPVARALADLEDQKRVIVEGHTDSRGSERANVRLSKRRAEAVRRFLIDQGAPGRRIRAVGKGEGTPVADNDTAEGRASNRRVEIVIQDIDS